MRIYDISRELFSAPLYPGDPESSFELLSRMETGDEYNLSTFCACTHAREFLTRVNQLRLGLGQAVPYINTGVLLMNLAALRQEQDEQAVIDYAKDRGQWFMLPDQDIITALYGSRIRLLDTMIYNLSDRMLATYNANPLNEKRPLSWVKANAAIIHYCGSNKPWKKNYIGVLDCFYHEVADAQ